MRPIEFYLQSHRKAKDEFGSPGPLLYGIFPQNDGTRQIAIFGDKPNRQLPIGRCLVSVANVIPDARGIDHQILEPTITPNGRALTLAHALGEIILPNWQKPDPQAMIGDILITSEPVPRRRPQR